MENIKEQLEEVIKKEKLESELAIFWDKISSYLPKSIERSALGDDKIFTAFKQAYIEFRPLIADEVLKVMVEKIEKEFPDDTGLNSYIKKEYILSLINKK